MLYKPMHPCGSLELDLTTIMTISPLGSVLNTGKYRPVDDNYQGRKTRVGGR